jgi:TonB family protein
LKNLVYIFFYFAFFSSKAQENILTIADSMPKFPGGTLAMARFMQMKISVPAEVLENSNAAKTFVKFVVDSSGKVKDPQVIKSSGYKSFDAEAVRIISNMPTWEPGINKGQKVNVFMTIPVSYKNIGVVAAQPVTEEHETAMKYWNEGHKLEQQNKFDKALERYEKALSVEPKNKFALFDRGKMLMALGDKKKACDIWNNMVQMNIRGDEAAEYIKKYCGETANKTTLFNELKSNSFFNSGMDDVRYGRYEAALRKFDSCLKYTPEYKDALFNKSIMHEKLDQKKLACNTWKKILDLSPEDKEVQELLKKNCN